MQTIARIGAREAARRLGISRRTLYTYTRDGIVSAAQLPNGFYRYDTEEIERLAKLWGMRRITNEQCADDQSPSDTL